MDGVTFFESEFSRKPAASPLTGEPSGLGSGGLVVVLSGLAEYRSTCTGGGPSVAQLAA